MDELVTIIGAAGGAGVVLFVGMIAVQRLLENAVTTASDVLKRELDSALVRAEASHLQAIELAAEEATDVRGNRIALYQDLWAHTGILPKWPRDERVTWERLIAHRGTLSGWYFDGGGMFLSQEARDAYGEVQKRLTKAADEGRQGSLKKDKHKDEYEEVRQLFSALRTQLTADLASRERRPGFSPAAAGEAPDRDDDRHVEDGSDEPEVERDGSSTSD